MKTLPKDYIERMRSLLKDEYPLYEKAVNESPVRAFRVNTSKISLEDFEKINPFSDEKIPYVLGGYYVDFDKIGNHPFHHAGLIYVQEPAAMMPAECIDIDANWTVLDMCAAPGGKSTQIKNKLSENSVLVSNEIIPSRCKILSGNIERLGLKNCVVTCLDTKKLASLYPKTFDLVMVDAPCSGEGMFRKDDIAIAEWSEENSENCAKRQLEILENAALCVKDGGYIVYATCTFSLCENEMVIDSFLKNHSEFELIPVTERVINTTSDGIFFNGCETENISFARRFYPHKAKGEGQFAAVLHNKNAGYEKVINRSAKPKIDKIVFDFLDDTLENYTRDCVEVIGDKVIYFTPDFEVKGNPFLKGITIGEIKKNYILPHHQFFMAMGENFRRKIELELESNELKKYLHGEEIDTSLENGWAAVTVCGKTLGGVKVSSGRGKNHYPKGLRLK